MSDKVSWFLEWSKAVCVEKTSDPLLTPTHHANRKLWAWSLKKEKSTHVPA